jgi:3alpha(or 20beta)-hydroxysteroid dehydrogenase
MGDLDGKTILVTGAARGSGAAIAGSCVRKGAFVILGDIARDELAATAAGLGPSARTVHLDVTEAGSWEEAACVVRADNDRLDVLVNNAGILLPASLEDQSIDDFRRTLDGNLVGVVLGMKTFVTLHRESASNGGSIIDMSSVRGIVGGTNVSAYCATKFGVRGLTTPTAAPLPHPPTQRGGEPEPRPVLPRRSCTKARMCCRLLMRRRGRSRRSTGGDRPTDEAWGGADRHRVATEHRANAPRHHRHRSPRRTCSTL